MQEDTENFNENSNSEVIILPQNTHLEETLISDEDETDNETALSYDTKLNAKLKDLGLYEDGMTIQQKEELLAVVAVSFKTAEEEKSRRQWYEEYANAALAFPEDEIEFSFQQSPDSELSTKASCYAGDYDESNINTKKNSNAEIDSAVASGSSNCDDYDSLPSTSQSSGYKAKSHTRKNRAFKGAGSAYKLSLDEGNTVTSHSTIAVYNSTDDLPTTNKQKKRFLEKCMSRWRPCLSPKEESLSCSNRPMSNETQKELLVPTESECHQKREDFNQQIRLALTVIKQSRKKPSHFGKPYHLTRNGHSLKKTTKLDSFDTMIGVQEGKNDSETEAGTSSNYTPLQKEAFSRTSGGAFRVAQFQVHRDRISALGHKSTIVNNHTSSLVKHSSLRYGVQKGIEECRTFPEIVIEDGFETADIPLPVNFDSNPRINNHHQANSSKCFDDDVIAENDFDNTKLPKFSNLRPDLCSLSEKNVLSRHVSLTYNTINSNERSNTNMTFRKENHFDSSSQDGNLSDSSSVIDVETIVDDEIEEFVLKRKLLQQPIVSEKQSYSNRPKRLKKNT